MNAVETTATSNVVLNDKFIKKSPIRTYWGFFFWWCGFVFLGFGFLVFFFWFLGFGVLGGGGGGGGGGWGGGCGNYELGIGENK